MKKFLALSAISLLTAVQLSAGEDVDPDEWRIDRDAKDPVVTEDLFSATTSGSDTVIVPRKFEMFNSSQYPFLRFQLSMDAAQPTTAQFFWATDSEPQFNEKNSARATIPADGKMHTYLIDLSKLPGWNGRITAIRFDPVAIPKDKPCKFTVGDFEFFGYDDDFKVPGSAWKQFNHLAEVSETNDVVTGKFITGKNDPFICAGVPALPAEKYQKVSLKLKVDPGAEAQAQLFWFNETTKTYNQNQQVVFPIIADGMFHEYEVVVGGNPNWTGKIMGIRVDLSTNPGSSAGFALTDVELED